MEFLILDHCEGGIAKFLCLTDLPLLGQIPGMSGFSIDVEALRYHSYIT